MSGHANSLKAIFLALGANFAIFLAKLVAALLTGSGAMLAEAVHSLADCGNQGMLLLGMRQSRRPPSDEFPLGWGRALYFWSFLVAILLFTVGGMFSLYEGIHKLSHPEPLKWPWLALGVLVFGIVAEGISMRGCMQEVNKAREGQPLWTWFRETRSSELLVIFGEDLAALVGLSLAALAVGATQLTGNLAYDAHRHRGHRRAADRGGGAAGDRGQGAADRPGHGAAPPRGTAGVPAATRRSGPGTQPDHPADGARRDGVGQGADGAHRPAATT